MILFIFNFNFQLTYILRGTIRLLVCSYLMIAMVFQFLWSLFVALVDVYAMIAHCSIQCLYFTKVLALGDWVMIFSLFQLMQTFLHTSMNYMFS